MEKKERGLKNKKYLEIYNNLPTVAPETQTQAIKNQKIESMRCTLSFMGVCLKALKIRKVNLPSLIQTVRTKTTPHHRYLLKTNTPSTLLIYIRERLCQRSVDNQPNFLFEKKKKKNYSMEPSTTNLNH